jgi:rhodanese-related sulfurtransferase
MTTTIPMTDTINAAKLKQMMTGDPALRILDVRTGGEFESLHIPGSYNVPLDTLGEHVRDLADVSHPVVLVCQSGGRATQAHAKLTGAGKEALHILEGGMNGWVEASGDVVRGDVERWVMERQVRFAAGLLILIGIVGSLLHHRTKWFSAGIASGLVFSAATNTCAMGNVLAKLPYNRTDRCDIAGVLERLNETSA